MGILYMDSIILIGYIASFFCSITFVPQAIKTLKSRQTDDIALNMLLFSFIGNSCWLIHAISLGITPLALSASMILTFNTPILIMKLSHMYKKRFTQIELQVKA
ncbi:MAG: hypothetical protein CMF61_00055 [Magnetococcales bacterium]|nr:hypothetical protein [Magnetococcales bacterium]